MKKIIKGKTCNTETSKKGLVNVKQLNTNYNE